MSWSKNIVGFVPLSMVDWEDHMCCVLFLRGCPFRCEYCHNAPLVEGNVKTLEWDDVLKALRENHEFVDRITVSGGEPLMYPDILTLLRTLKEEGFRVKVDTNGYYPEMLEKVCDSGLVEYVALDVKAPLDRTYDNLVGVRDSFKQVARSIGVLSSSKLEYLFRTTVSKTLGIVETRAILGDLVKYVGHSDFRWKLQRYQKTDSCLFDKGRLGEYSPEEFEFILDTFKNHIINER